MLPARLVRVLEHRRIALFAAIAGMLLCAPSITSGLATEDFLFRAAVLRLKLHDVPWQLNLYDAQEVMGGVHLAQTLGHLPWVTPEEFRISFWRPLGSLTHQFDYGVLPFVPELMHVHSLLWYGALIWGCAALYRRLLGTSAGALAVGLATVLYAIDDAHGQAVGWLANRHAVVAACFGVWALVAHDRWRRDGWRAGAALASLLLAASLGTGELGIGVLAYFVAHAVWLDPAKGPRKLVPLLPALVVGVLWFAAYRGLGHGARASGMYLDPLHQPAAFWIALPERLGANLLGLVLGPPAQTWHLLSPGMRTVYGQGALGIATALVGLLVRMARAGARARFLATGAVLSTVPLCATFPSDRTLFLPGVGISALVALAVVRATEARWQRGTAVALLAVHGLLAGALLPYRSLTMARFQDRLERASSTAFQRMSSRDHYLVVLNAPDYYFCKMLREVHWAAGHQNTAPHLCLVGHRGPLEITTIDPHGIEVRTTGLLERPFSRLYRSADRPMQPGDTLRLHRAQIRVLEVDADGQPTRILFRLAWPLGSPAMPFVVWKAGEYVAFDPPPVGESVVVDSR